MSEQYGPVEGVYKVAYSENVKLFYQQKGLRIAPSMSYLPNVKGFEMQVLEVIGETNARADAPESAPTPIILPPHEAIYVKPRRRDWGTTVRRSMALKALTDYTSPYVQTGVTAIVKSVDNSILIPAILGPRLVKYGDDEDAIPVSVPFDTINQQLPANTGGAGATGLTVKKFIAAIEKLSNADIDIDSEEITLGLTARQNSDLYNEIQFVNNQYRAKAAFDDKRITEFMGIKFVRMQQLPLTPDVNGTLSRSCPMYCKSFVGYGDPMPPTTMLDRDASLQYQVRPYIDSWWAATRFMDKGVVDIRCAEA